MAIKTAPESAPVGAIALDDLDTVEGLAASYPRLLSVPTLRWQLRHRDENGLATACVAVGKKLLISRTRYEAWLGSRAGKVTA
ncbi:MAG: hypothetical protein Q8M01_04335 [Rubrivivax sp.]|nr:hypothetical protein [Rubrivivax sp.]